MTTAPLRSLLFVPGDSERKQAKALHAGADALILDLEDSVAEVALPEARARVRHFLSAHAPETRSSQLWVRLNSLASGKLLEDLDAVMVGRPDGVVLPKVSSVEEVQEVGRHLSAREARQSTEGGTRLIVIATETPQALLKLGDYSPATAGERLAGLTWGMEDLSAALGALAKTEADGSLTPIFELARSLCLIAAAAAGVQAIDGVEADFRDTARLERDVARARRDGFTAKLAIHPDQVPIINAVFTPTVAEVEQARRVIAAFASAQGAGVTSLDGKMLDRPHLILARRVLQLAARAPSGK